VLLVIEVADATGDYDRNVKVLRYARARISQVWVVDLHERVIGVCDEPGGTTYRGHRRIRTGESVAIPGVPGHAIAAGDILA